MVVRWHFSFLSNFKWNILEANGGDHDQALRCAASGLGLHCWPGSYVLKLYRVTDITLKKNIWTSSRETQIMLHVNSCMRTAEVQTSTPLYSPSAKSIVLNTNYLNILCDFSELSLVADSEDRFLASYYN